MLSGLLIFLALLSIVYFLGPRPEGVKFYPDLPAVPSDLLLLEKEIADAENATADLKPDNEARIIWADSLKRKTAYSIVYIHGFGASWAEGDPVHKNIAAKYGANLYLSRMHDAGLNDPNAFDDLTPQNFVEGAKRALAIGKQLGDSVIVIGTSAGGLLSVYLAAHHPEIKALVLYSPCIKTYKNKLAISTGPWGEKIMKWVLGEHDIMDDDTPGRKEYWLTSQNTNGYLSLQKTIDAVARPEIYSRIKMPVFLGYYYKNNDEQDKTVSVEAMKQMFEQLGTPESQKIEKSFPESGHHVIASRITSKDWQSVQKETENFLESVAGVKPGSVTK